MATECDRFCWPEVSADLNSLDSGPLKAMLTHTGLMKLNTKTQRKVCLKQGLSLSTGVAIKSFL